MQPVGRKRKLGGLHQRKTLHWQSKALKAWTALWDYYYFLFIYVFFTKSKVTFNVLKVPEIFCPFTKKKADAETLAPVLKRCSERSIMRDIKASQSPPPLWTHSIKVHIEGNTFTENATFVALQASFSHPFSALLLQCLITWLFAEHRLGLEKRRDAQQPLCASTTLHVSFCELNVLESITARAHPFPPSRPFLNCLNKAWGKPGTFSDLEEETATLSGHIWGCSNFNTRPPKWACPWATVDSTTKPRYIIHLLHWLIWRPECLPKIWNVLSGWMEDNFIFLLCSIWTNDDLLVFQIRCCYSFTLSSVKLASPVHSTIL